MDTTTEDGHNKRNNNNTESIVVDKRKSFSFSYFDEDEEETKDNATTTSGGDQDILFKLQEQMIKANAIKNKSAESKESIINNTLTQSNAEKEKKEQEDAEETEDEEKEKKEQDKEKEEKEEEDKRKENKKKMDKRVTEDLKGLFTPDSFFVLKDMALEGNLDLTGLRGITWRVLLGVLSADTSMWADQTQKHREKFAKLREKYIIDPHKASAAGSELDKFNPLSQHEENPWNQYFQDAELQKEITHDVQLLFLYAKEHSTIRYIQGMNELLAPIIYVLHHESTPLSDSPTIFDIVSSEADVVADSYTLFSHLLLIVGRWFSPLKSPNSPPISISKKDTLLDDKLYLSGQADESTNLQIVQQCRHIHYDLLNEVEPHLSRYLRDLQIEPHLYMLRWVRIVLTQVFTLPDVLIIWDGIFAFGNNAVLLDWLCVAMLVTIRHNLLGQDYSCCMQLLFNYPQNQDVRVLVGTARQLYNKYQNQRQITPPKSVSSTSLAVKSPTTNTVTQKSATSAQKTPVRSQSPAHAQSPQPRATTGQSTTTMRERAPTPPNAPQFPQAFPEPSPRPSTPGSGVQNHKQKSILQMIFPEAPEAANAAFEEAQHLKNVSAHMANRLERVLFLLSSLPSTPENEETIKLVSEEVNQIKGTLVEASEFKLKSSSLETFDQRQQKTINNNNNAPTNNNYSNTVHANIPPANNVNNAHNTHNNTPNSPPQDQANVYEKILGMDPLNIFRRK